MAKLFADACNIAITSFISPFRADRDAARKLHADAGIPFIEVFADASLDIVKNRDPKGLYKKALAGEIKGARDAHGAMHADCAFSDFTGVSSPYEPPLAPEIHINSGETPVDKCVEVRCFPFLYLFVSNASVGDPRVHVRQPAARQGVGSRPISVPISQINIFSVE